MKSVPSFYYSIVFLICWSLVNSEELADKSNTEFCIGGSHVMGFEAPQVESDYEMALNISQAMIAGKLSFQDLQTNLTAHYIFNFNDKNQTYSIDSLEMHLSSQIQNQQPYSEYSSAWHGHELIPNDRHTLYQLDKQYIDKVYFDFLGNLAGFTLENPDTQIPTEVGERLDQSYIELGPYLKQMQHFRMVGFRTTKNCITSKVIKSLQIIYLSNNQSMCDKYLQPISKEHQTEENCPIDEYEFSAQLVMNITGWSKEVLQMNLREKGTINGNQNYYQRRAQMIYPIVIFSFALLVFVVICLFIYACQRVRAQKIEEIKAQNNLANEIGGESINGLENNNLNSNRIAASGKRNKPRHPVVQAQSSNDFEMQVNAQAAEERGPSRKPDLSNATAEVSMNHPLNPGILNRS